MPVPFWRCEKCRREFDSREGAEGCEAGHLLPVSAVVVGYGIRSYPYSLEVTFNNGGKKIYNAEEMGG